MITALLFTLMMIPSPPAPVSPPETTQPPEVTPPPVVAKEEVPAEDVSPISLADILGRAVSHNRGLREAGLKIQVSRATVKATTAMFDTQLAANLNVVSQSAEFVPGQFFAVTGVEKYSFDAQLARLLPTGGSVAIQFSSSRTDQTMTIAMGPTPTENVSKSFTNSFMFVFTHPLLAGFGKDVTTTATQKARIQLDADRLAREARAQGLVRDLVIAYWNLWMYWQEQDLLGVSLQVARSQLELTKTLLTVGHAKASDLLAVQNAVAQREGDLMLSRLRILQASLSIKSQLDLPLDEEPRLLRPAERDLAFVVKSLPADLVAQTLKRSKDLAQLERQLDLLRQEEKLARQGLLPKLNVTLTAGPSGSSDEYSKAWEGLVKFSGFTITGGLSFSWTVERTQARATLELVDANARLLRLARENLSQGLIQGVLLARESMKTAERRIALADLAVQSAEAHLKLENDLFSLGRGTNHSVLLRMAELDAARLSRIKAVYDYWTSWVQIQALSGVILEEFKIELKD